MAENKIYNIDEIMKMLPHRYPFLLVDRLEVEVPGEKGIGLKNLTMNELFFQGHFPNNPIMPGVLQVEAMAQTAGCVVLSAILYDAGAGFRQTDLGQRAPARPPHEWGSQNQTRMRVHPPPREGAASDP